MNIVYATRAAVPYPSAASINTVQMCESLATLGHEVTLALGEKFWRPRFRDGDLWSYYGIEENFDVARILELPRTGMFFDGRVIQLARRRSALLYARYTRVLERAVRSGIPTVLETHSVPGPAGLQAIRECFASENFRGVVVITHALKRDLVNALGLPGIDQKVVVAPDAVNPHRFTPSDAGRQGRPVRAIGYVGSLYSGKGLEVLIPLARHFSELPFYVFGGKDAEVQEWRTRTADCSNIHWEGFLKPSQVPEQFNKFDIALLPNQPVVRMAGGDDIGSYTSPMKMFEYMAAGKGIIGSDLPVLTEVLRPGENSLTASHDAIDEWIAAVERLLASPELFQKISNQARREAERDYSYEARFRHIFRLLSLNSDPAGMKKAG